MAKRPIFIATATGPGPVEVREVEFEWFAGMAVSRKQLCIDSLHTAIRAQSPNARLLEISSKSRTPFGVNLSAFNLGFAHPKRADIITVECAFQGSKVFEGGGPFPELYGTDSRAAKKFFSERSLGRITGFNFFGQLWPAIPRTLFYDWLYLNSVYRTPAYAADILAYDTFTDIEFNPERSLNCQAHAAALFVALHRRGEIDALLKDRHRFMARHAELPSWIIGTSYQKHHAADHELPLDTDHE